MLKAIIIDDEARARRILTSFLDEYCTGITLVGVASDVVSGFTVIQKTKPDVVFLDIEMPGNSGFQLLEMFEEINFDVIFVTAYSEFAIRAFQVSAIDYLLKPVQIDQLIRAVEKAEGVKNNKLIKERLQLLKENLEEKKIRKIVVPVSVGSLFIDIDDITHLKAEGSYVNIFLKDGNKVLVSKNIKDYEELLNSGEGFFRTHRSYLVNIHAIKRLMDNNAEAMLQNNHTIQIARERRADFMQFINTRSLNTQNT